MPRADMRIRIRRDATTRLGYRFNWSEFGQPSLANFKQCLTQEQRRLNSTYTWSSWTTQQAAAWYMNQPHYTCQQMADLLGKVTLLDRAASEGTCAIMGENFSRAANPFDSCYLNMGASMFKLIPVAIADVTQPLRLMRERVQQETQVTRDETLAAAGREATIVTNAAEATRARVEHELAVAERDRGIVLPTWIRHADHLPVIFVDSYSFPIDVGMRLNFTIEAFSFVHRDILYEWDAVHRVRIRALVWMRMHPVTGRYNLESTKLDSSYIGELPHIDHTHACLAPTGLPGTIGNQDTLLQVKQAIGRCYSRVNMNSLLCHVDIWSREARRTAPDAVINFWEASDHGRQIPTNDADEVDPAYFHADRVIPMEQERQTTWHANRLDQGVPTNRPLDLPPGDAIPEPNILQPGRRPDETALEYINRMTAEHPQVQPLTPEQTAAAVAANEANETEVVRDEDGLEVEEAGDEV